MRWVWLEKFAFRFLLLEGLGGFKVLDGLLLRKLSTMLFPSSLWMHKFNSSYYTRGQKICLSSAIYQWLCSVSGCVTWKTFHASPLVPLKTVSISQAITSHSWRAGAHLQRSSGTLIMDRWAPQNEKRQTLRNTTILAQKVHRPI